jgi:amino acid adenylation domain-containing protein
MTPNPSELEAAELKADGIAIIGMAGRFPGARNPGELWQNLKQGIESISRFTVAELGVRNAAAVASDPDYVRARGVVADPDLFDAAFFDIHPKEAELIDPQHRVFLECCWEALEDSGHDPTRMSELVGVFAGCSQNSYFLTQVCENQTFLRDYAEAYQSGYFPTLLGTIGDTLATRVSYKLNLQGPSMTVSCACSTSLVAVSQACASLAGFQCDMALAGGVSISFPQNRGYLHQAGGMVSPDGHCRSFDADAQGTVFGGGAGVVVLKRLAEALQDGDHIYAVIRGIAVNNDGRSKVGFTAPGVDGQARVVAMAQALAGVDPRTIGYIEAHGTATPLGDPVEVEALTQVFRESTPDKGFCALGTVKTNIGHLDIAAGATGLIKAALTLKHKQLTPTLHFCSPNPKLKLDTSPFYVNTELREWKIAKGELRRAGVSAFGLGGTNCHAVLEEAPKVPETGESRAHHLLVFSAKSPEALLQAKRRFAEHLRNHPDLNLADSAFTLQTGRTVFPFRSTVVCGNAEDAIAALDAEKVGDSYREATDASEPAVYFMFPGQGSQVPGMGRGLYCTEPRFRGAVDECAEILKPRLGLDIRDAIFTDSQPKRSGAKAFHHTSCAQPAIFTISYALARLWMHWGIRPQGMVGHSVGEFVCACLSGVFSLEDALRVVAERAALMSGVPEGAMLAVRLPERELLPLLNGNLSLAAVNAPGLTVAAGPLQAIAALEQYLQNVGVAAARLMTSHAFHSAMMDPVLAPLAGTVKGVRLNPPRIPWVSGVTGGWITDAQATDPAYWAKHCRQTVRFAEAIETLGGRPGAIFLEAGPGTTLQTLTKRNLPSGVGRRVFSSLREPVSADGFEIRDLLETLGKLWVAGVKPEWNNFYEGEPRRRTPLPTYPFERKRYWIERPEAAPTPSVPDPDTNEESTMEKTQPQTKPGANVQRPDRSQRLLADLTTILQDLSGIDSSLLDPSASFLDLGFDSLFLTQFSQSILSRFGLKVTFRQLLDRISSLSAVAAYLDEKLPQSEEQPAQGAPPPLEPLTPKAAAQPTATAPVAVDFTVQPVAADASAMERIIAGQLQAMTKLMADQLAALKGGPAASATSVTLAPPTPAAELPRPERKRIDEPVAIEKGPKVYQPFNPIQRTPRAQLTPGQQAWLDRLVARYTARTAESKRLTQKYRRVLADPRVAAGFRSIWKEVIYPITTSRSEGARLWDLDGNEYIDLVNGFGPISFGHRPDFVVDAVGAQLKQGIEIGPQTPLAGEVAELLCELTGMERATFCNTGSEAVMAAVRLARTVTGRSKIVLFAGDYHGNYEEVLAKRTGREGSLKSGPAAPGITQEAVANVIVLDYGTPEALRAIREHASELAAVLVEPVQSRHPNLRPRDFLQEIRNITAASGTALIFDEIVTGFRVHQGGAQAMYGIQADMATYGKILGGGLPIGAVAGRAKFMDALDGGMWNYGDDSYPEADVTFFAGTFVRHPLALAASRAVLRHIKESGPRLQEELTNRTARLVGRLNAAFARSRMPAAIETCGSWFYWSFPNDFQFGSLFYIVLREKGVHILEGFPCFVTTAHSDADLDRIEQAFAEACLEMAEGGLLTESTAPETKPERLPAVTLPKLVEPPPVEAPLTEAQMEIWLSTQLSPEAACAYNESFSLRLRGDLNRDALLESLREVIGRHDALRSRFDAAGPSLQLSGDSRFEVPLVDLGSIEPEQRESRLSRMVSADAATPFDLTLGPAVRAVLVSMSSDDHVLVFTAHHIVCDGWSVNVILRELSSIYSERCGGAAAALTQPLSFLRYASDQKRRASSAEMTEVEHFWLARFAEPAPVLDLPLDRPRPSVKSFAGATCRRRIDTDLYRSIKRSGARQGATLTATLLAGFQTLLFRLTGQEEVVIGIPAAAQSLLEEETLVGHCVNFLPIRGRLAQGATFADLLSQTRQELLDAFEHQTYTFGTLVNRLKIKRDPSRLPLVEVQFNLERLAGDVEFGGLKAEIEANPKAAVNFDLFLNIQEGLDGLVLDCDYNRDLFDETTIQRWLNHYVTLLAAAADGMNKRVAELSLLDKTEFRHQVVERNNTQAEYPHDRRIDQLVDQQAARTPNAVAVGFENSTLTYEQLSARSNRLARYLSRHGAGPGTRVAVLIERSLSIPEALLAVLKCGAAYVPLDLTMPWERIRTIIQDSKASIVLTGERQAVEMIHPIEARLVCLDVEATSVEKESSAAPRCAAAPTDPAYVIYTSGSTGKPKGVEVTHRSVTNLLWSMAAKPGIAASDRLLAVTTLSFDIAGLEIFLPLVKGATVVICARTIAMDGFLLARSIQSSGITMLQATPSTWQLLLDAGWRPDPNLRMLCGGEALPRPLAERLLENSGNLWNMYGPTETTIWSAVSKVRSGSGPVPIGPPIANTQFYILSREGQICPLGVAGQLHIGGDGLAAGYDAQPDLTAASFIADPFRTTPGARIYKTGDLARALPDGEMEFLGRLDNQVKLHGFRIELGEIEGAIAEHPGVREVAVVLAQIKAGDKRLIAYVGAEEGQMPTVANWRQFLSARLPAYMVPSHFVRMDQLPRMENGKLARKALPILNLTTPVESRETSSPANAAEEKLMAICKDVLELDRLGLEDDLFDFGADSIRIFQIAARAMDAGIETTALSLMRSRTVAAACRLAQSEELKLTNNPGIHIARASREQYVLKHAASAR